MVCWSSDFFLGIKLVHYSNLFYRTWKILGICWDWTWVPIGNNLQCERSTSEPASPGFCCFVVVIKFKLQPNPSIDNLLQGYAFKWHLWLVKAKTWSQCAETWILQLKLYLQCGLYVLGQHGLPHGQGQLEHRIPMCLTTLSPFRHHKSDPWK